MVAEDKLGKSPRRDINRNLNRLVQEIGWGNRAKAIELTYTVESLAKVVLTVRRGSIDDLKDAFNEIRVYLRTRGHQSCEAACQDPIRDIQDLLMGARVPITPVL